MQHRQEHAQRFAAKQPLARAFQRNEPELLVVPDSVRLGVHDEPNAAETFTLVQRQLQGMPKQASSNPVPLGPHVAPETPQAKYW